MSTYQVPPAAHAERMARRIAADGLVLERCGRGWRVSGPGVDVLVVDLAHLTAADLVPAHRHTARSVDQAAR